MSGSAAQMASHLIPELIIGSGVVLILLWGMLFPRKKSVNMSLFCLVILIAALFTLVLKPGSTQVVNLLAAGGWPVLFRIIIIFAASLIVFLSHDYLANSAMPASEYYLLILMATLGMMITVVAGHLLLLFLGIELMSLSFVLLAALVPGSARSKEAALKYLMYGLTASALLVFGLSVLYGLYGSLDLMIVGNRIAGGSTGSAGVLAMVMILTGIGFKIGLVPFHMWIPDVYDGSPAPVAAFLSVGPKVAALGAAGYLFIRTFAGLSDIWYPMLWVMGVASMCWGNLAAMAQRNLRRMMAYSSIAHVGYLSIGLLVAARMPLDGLSSMAFYLFAYFFFNIGFFVLIIWGEGSDGAGPTLDDVSGLGRTNPLMGAVFTVFLLALAGIPPTSGFMAKFVLFMSAVRADMTALAVIGVLNSALASYYYLRVVYYLFMNEPVAGREMHLTTNIGVYSLILAAVTVFWFGIWPEPLLEIVRTATLP